MPRASPRPQAERPDCILLDLEMPRLGGVEVLERLEQDPRTREIPVSIITAARRQHCRHGPRLPGGAVDYITKPISPAREAMRVRGAIERRRLLQVIQGLRASFTRCSCTTCVARSRSSRAISGSSSTTTDARMPRDVLSIRGSCDKMISLIAQSLDLSKLEAGALTPEWRPIDLGELVGEMLENFRSRSQPTGRGAGPGESRSGSHIPTIFPRRFPPDSRIEVSGRSTGSDAIGN